MFQRKKNFKIIFSSFFKKMFQKIFLEKIQDVLHLKKKSVPIFNETDPQTHSLPQHLMSRSTCFRLRPPRHLREISELQAHQRGEVELLYRRLGKAPPPGLGLSNVAPHSSRRKRSNRHKLKPGKLLSPLVQQFRNVTSKTSDSTRSGECRFTHAQSGHRGAG